MKSAKRIKLIAKFMAAVLTLGTVVGVAAGCKKTHSEYGIRPGDRSLGSGKRARIHGSHHSRV